jgi:hypothetical protein
VKKKMKMLEVVMDKIFINSSQLKSTTANNPLTLLIETRNTKIIKDSPCIKIKLSRREMPIMQGDRRTGLLHFKERILTNKKDQKELKT